MGNAILDFKNQLMLCKACGASHPLDDGVNGKEVWYASGVMMGFSKHHEDCEERKDDDR